MENMTNENEHHPEFRYIKSCAPYPRHFKIKNYVTGEIIEADNVTQWCQKQGLPKFAKIQIFHVLSGKLKSYLNYCLPETIIEERFAVKNLKTGKIYKSFDRETLSKQTKITIYQITNLKTKKRDRFQEWAAPDFDLENIKKLPLLKNIKTGRTHRLFESWSEFCKNNGLVNSAATVLKKRGQHKDWVYLKDSP